MEAVSFPLADYASLDTETFEILSEEAKIKVWIRVERATKLGNHGRTERKESCSRR